MKRLSTVSSRISVVLFAALLGGLSLFASDRLVNDRSDRTESAGKTAVKAEPGKTADTPVSIPTKIPKPDPVVNVQAVTPLINVRPMAGEQIKWQVISAGGNKASSASHVLNLTIGQTASGSASSASYILHEGFVQNFNQSNNCCTAKTTGDLDGTGSVDISDLSALVDYLFNSLPFPGTCYLEQDVDKSGSVDISDLSMVVDFLFSGGALPSCP